MKDPAVGRTRSERALGESHPNKKKKKGVSPKARPSKKAPQKSKKKTAPDTRNVNNGMFSGPRPSYQRYNVSEQASDILNRSKRNMDMR